MTRPAAGLGVAGAAVGDGTAVGTTGDGVDAAATGVAAAVEIGTAVEGGVVGSIRGASVGLGGATVGAVVGEGVGAGWQARIGSAATDPARRTNARRETARPGSVGLSIIRKP